MGRLQVVTKSTSLRAGRFDRFASRTLRCKQSARTHWRRKITIGLSILLGTFFFYTNYVPDSTRYVLRYRLLKKGVQ